MRAATELRVLVVAEAVAVAVARRPFDGNGRVDVEATSPLPPVPPVPLLVFVTESMVVPKPLEDPASNIRSIAISK